MVETTPELIKIRRAEPADTDAIHRVFVSAIRAIEPEYYTEQQKVAWEQAVSPESWSTRLLELDFWVAEFDDLIVGFISWSEGLIEHVYVSGEHVRKGVGVRLMTHALERCPNTDLNLTASLNAVRFYQRFGFSQLEAITKQRGGIDIPCIQMVRTCVKIET